MFDASFPELLVVFVIGLLVLGPERLPKVARTIGLWVGRARGMFAQVRSELEREANLQELQQAQRELKQSLEDGNRTLAENVKPVSDAVETLPEALESTAAAPKDTAADDTGSKHATP
jgi:sec-independent protein translocase protein TatB